MSRRHLVLIAFFVFVTALASAQGAQGNACYTECGINPYSRTPWTEQQSKCLQECRARLPPPTPQPGQQGSQTNDSVVARCRTTCQAQSTVTLARTRTIDPQLYSSCTAKCGSPSTERCTNGARKQGLETHSCANASWFLVSASPFQPSPCPPRPLPRSAEATGAAAGVDDDRQSGLLEFFARIFGG